jgi:hypothetical protein
MHILMPKHAFQAINHGNWYLGSGCARTWENIFVKIEINRKQQRFTTYVRGGRSSARNLLEIGTLVNPWTLSVMPSFISIRWIACRPTEVKIEDFTLNCIWLFLRYSAGKWLCCYLSIQWFRWVTTWWTRKILYLPTVNFSANLSINQWKIFPDFQQTANLP